VSINNNPYLGLLGKFSYQAEALDLGKNRAGGTIAEAVEDWRFLFCRFMVTPYTF
jgi:hypothetical protein